MSKKNPPSARLVWAIIGAAIVVCVLISVLLYVLFGSPRQEDLSVTEDAVATKEEVEKNVSDLESAIRTSVKDQSAAKAALKDDTKRITLGES
tara:strand:+ start:7219 stop:7497 length:279 start_codon:yes stop_codon:yes gene_type:complete